METESQGRAEACGCPALPRRRCDVCYAAGQEFLACSHACLSRHLPVHGEAHRGSSGYDRAAALLSDMNARHPDSSERFASHRGQLMQLVEAALASRGQQAPGSLLVLGVGNGSDLDLPWLTERFSAVHLVDLDTPALERARARQNAECASRLALHGGIDLSGVLEQLDAWGDAFPEPAALSAAAVVAARGLVRELGQHDVVLSTCVLSQLALPFRRSWVAPVSTWANLDAAITAVHLATLAGCCSRRAILAFDVQSKDGTPSPHPEALLTQLRAPGLTPLVDELRVTAPWRWDLGETSQTVYAIEFRHPS